MIPTELTIDVTQLDIQNGKPGDCANCAVALGALRAIKQFLPDDSTTCVSVGGVTLLFWGEDEGDFFNLAFNLPDVAANAIYRIDDGELVEPFTFTVTGGIAQTVRASSS